MTRANLASGEPPALSNSVQSAWNVCPLVPPEAARKSCGRRRFCPFSFGFFLFPPGVCRKGIARIDLDQVMEQEHLGHDKEIGPRLGVLFEAKRHQGEVPAVFRTVLAT